MKHLSKDRTAKLKELLKKAPIVSVMDKSKDLQALHHFEKKKEKHSKLPQKSKDKFFAASDMTQQEIDG
jgi:flavorubredoxin